MRMIRTSRILSWALAVTVFAWHSPTQLRAQAVGSYTMDFVRAAMVKADGQPMLVVVLVVTPLVDDFKLVLSMKLSYDLGDGERSIELQRSPGISIHVYDKDVESKSTKVYRFVKDRVDLRTEKNIFLVRFDFRDLGTETVKDMWLKYGLWEGENDEIRHEQEYRFPVEDLR